MMYDQPRSVLETPINIITTVVWLALILGFIPIVLVWWLFELSTGKLWALRKVFSW